MINTVPNPAASNPGNPAVSPQPGILPATPAIINGTGTTTQVPDDLSAATKPSFASTLHNRLKLIAFGKAQAHELPNTPPSPSSPTASLPPSSLAPARASEPLAGDFTPLPSGLITSKPGESSTGIDQETDAKAPTEAGDASTTMATVIFTPAPQPQSVLQTAVAPALATAAMQPTGMPPAASSAPASIPLSIPATAAPQSAAVSSATDIPRKHSVIPAPTSPSSSPLATGQSQTVEASGNPVSPSTLQTNAVVPAPIAPVPAAIIATPAEKNALLPANHDTGASDLAETMGHFQSPAGIASAQQLPAATTSTPPVPIREVTAHLGSPQWPTEVGTQIGWMATQRESRADLVLHPPQLGRIEVSITLNGDLASASFVSTSAEVRDVLQGSLPRLREVLAEAGLFLGRADIGAESFRQGGNAGEKGGKSADDLISPRRQSLLGSPNTALPSDMRALTGSGRGLIDLFA